jgi:pilus assembly protein CpaF
MHDLFHFEQHGVNSEGHAQGHFVCSGIRPRVAERIENRGIRLPMDLFQRRTIEG